MFGPGPKTIAGLLYPYLLISRPSVIRSSLPSLKGPSKLLPSDLKGQFLEIKLLEILFKVVSLFSYQGAPPTASCRGFVLRSPATASLDYHQNNLLSTPFFIFF